MEAVLGGDRFDCTKSRSNTRLLFWLSLVIATLLLAPAAMAQGSSRVALIIGNAVYPDAGAPLSTTSNDVRTVADEFRRLDFDVELKSNLGKDGMRRAIDAFTAKVNKGTVALFYFSGFGVQVDRRTYLIPVDAQIWNEADVRRDAISVDGLLADLQRRGAKVKIVILDAGRRNPFERRFRPLASGLAPLDAPEGTLALFSAAPDAILRDGDSVGATSIFVSELVKQLAAPKQTAEQAFNRTRIGVSRASNNEIVPWVASSLLDELYFQPTPQTAAAPAPAPSTGGGSSSSPPEPAPSPPGRPQATSEPPRESSAPAPVEPGQVFRDCSICPEMVVVPAGAFIMGGKSEFERPAHRVSIKNKFAIGRYEVTFDEWERCADEGACRSRPGDRGWGRGTRPVINVSWLDAKAFAAWLSQRTGQKYRLPTESEWEYVARAGTTTMYWWGPDVDSRRANCQNCGTGQAPKTLPVGSFKPNPFGIYETAGNAAEWVEDCWHPDYTGAPSDGSAWAEQQCQLRVLRGGAFDSEALYVSSAARFRYDYDVPYTSNGFRVVRELP